MKIILTGFMASGKSSVGQMLAQRLSCPYTDLDQVVNPFPKSFTKMVKLLFENLNMTSSLPSSIKGEFSPLVVVHLSGRITRKS